MEGTIIYHVDVNSAYLSWEAVEREKKDTEGIDLRNIPSVVGGDRKKRHGVVLAKSIPAKKYNIKTGEPIQQAIQKCPNLVIVSPNHDVYEEYSKRLLKILCRYTFKVEPFSIDEAFLDMTGLIPEDKTPKEFAIEIKDKIKEELRFTVNIGVSTNKLLAKMASDFKKPDMVHTLFPKEIPLKMWPLPVEELFLVGKSASNTLRNLGLKTIGDVAHTDLAILKSHLGDKTGEIIYKNSLGINNETVETDKPMNKGYGNSITLSEDVTNYKDACLVLLSLSETVAARMRENNVKCYCIAVEIKNHEFKRQTRQTTLANPTNTTDIIYETSCKLLKELWDKTPLRLLGIRGTKLTSDEYEQINLFQTQKEKKLERLDKALDRIRDKHGDAAIQRVSLAKQEEVKKGR